MGQRIGNVGLLNLLNATEESIKAYDRIENAGAVIYRKGQAHLLSALNIGNMGASMELPEDYSYYNGVLTIDAAYLQSLGAELKLLVNGTVIFGKDIGPEQLEKGLLALMVNGEIYAPAHLAGLVSRLFPAGNRTVNPYTGAPPRIENGNFTLSNAFLQAAELPAHLVINGMLTMPKDLDMDLFNEKISNIEVNGTLSVHEEQEVHVHKKMAASPNGVIQVIPAGYEVLKKIVKLNSRSIRSFQRKKLLTKKPLIFEKDIPRGSFEAAIEKIDSKSYIVCSEELEDLIYERLDRLETEVLSYEHQYILIEGEQEWSNDQFLSFHNPVNLIIEGVLVLNTDVTEEVLQDSLAAIDLFGEIQVNSKKTKRALQNKLRVNEGRIKEQGEAAEAERTGLQNVGELTL
jgi:hypothetical protein